MSFQRDRSTLPPARSEQPLCLGQKVRRALALAEISEKSAALTMGVDPSEFSKQLADRPGHYLSMARLCELPVEFWAYFLPSFVAWHGYQIESVDVQASLMADVLERCANLVRLASFASEEKHQPGKRSA